MFSKQILSGWLAIALLFAASDVTADTFTVDSTSDGNGDANPGDGTCATTALECTLRAAIEEANALQGDDIIDFGIAGSAPFRITLASELPPITDTVTINGLSPGSAIPPIIEIDGSGLGRSDSGIQFSGDGSVLRGLSIINFGNEGIRITGNFNAVYGNYVGLDVGGNPAANGTGIDVEGSNNQIGGSGAGAGGNVVSANSEYGIFVGLSGADSNVIAANIIGSDPDGEEALGNFFQGILVNGVSNTYIGGNRNLGSGNLIVDNGRGGIGLNSSTGATVIGNNIGTNAKGLELGNNGPGIEVAFGDQNEIGQPPMDEMGNVVADNTEQGILVSSDDNTVAANFVGGVDTNLGATLSLPNGEEGISLEGNNNLVGGASGEGNIFWVEEGLIAGDGNELFDNEFLLCGDPGVEISGSDNRLGATFGVPENIFLMCSGTGVAVVGSGAIGNGIRFNTFEDLAGPGIDLGDDGIDSNDDGDGDSGPNQRQNSPQLIDVSYDYDNDQVTVEYRVDSATANSAYPLEIDFYVADPDNPRAGVYWLDSDLYQSTDAQSTTTKVLNFPSQYAEGQLVATATDTDLNTSEFSNAIHYGGIFQDRFEN